MNAAICKRVRELIDDMRTDVYLAVRLDEFVKMVADSLDAPATADDVKKCIRRDSTVRIVETRDVEVLWLWDGWRLHSLIDHVVDMARRYRAVLTEAERHEEVVAEAEL
jgi:hypothetical protein